MKISHEVPACLLKESLNFSDYQYALPHLLEENEKYRNHFLKCKEDGVPIYLDNSLHELGEAMGEDILLKWIKILEPTKFFVPDVWENKNASIISAKYWVQFVLPKKVRKVAIIQAKSYSEAYLCLSIYKDLGYKEFAFSYGANYYKEITPHPNPDMAKALGRISVISKLWDSGKLTEFDSVHLLGCSLPQEFSWYKGISCIKSLDTSNPIMTALEGKYYEDFGLSEKPKANLNSHFDTPLKDINLNLIHYNVNMFRIINSI